MHLHLSQEGYCTEKGGREERRQQLTEKVWESQKRGCSHVPQCSCTRCGQGTQLRQPCLQTASPARPIQAGRCAQAPSPSSSDLLHSPALFPGRSAQAPGWPIDAVKPWKASPSSAFPRLLLLLAHAGVSSKCRASFTSGWFTVSSCQTLL